MWYRCVGGEGGSNIVSAMEFSVNGIEEGMTLLNAISDGDNIEIGSIEIDSETYHKLIFKVAGTYTFYWSLSRPPLNKSPYYGSATVGVNDWSADVYTLASSDGSGSFTINAAEGYEILFITRMVSTYKYNPFFSCYVVKES